MLAITSLFAGILILLQVVLSINVGFNRAKRKIDFGDGDDMKMHRSIRAHGNFIEYVPFVVIAMALSELAGAPAWLLWTSGSVLVFARLAHLAFMFEWLGDAARGAGAGLTALVMAALGVSLLAGASGMMS